MEQPWRDPDWLRQHYIDRGLSARQIAAIAGTDHTTILKWLSKHGIATRSRSEAASLRNHQNTERDVPWARWHLPAKPPSRPWQRAREVLVISDLHSPYIDPDAIGVIYAILEDHKPNALFIAGDGLDFFKLSVFDTSPLDGAGLDHERRVFIDTMKTIRELVGERTAMVYVGGEADNHLNRLIAFLKSNPALSQYHALQPEYVLGVEEWDGEYVESPVELWDNFVICHSYKRTSRGLIRKHSAYTARALAEVFQASGVTGHSHRLGAFYYRPALSDAQEIVFVECGCLCFLSPPFDPRANWQQGAVWVTFEDGQPFVELIHIRDGRTIFRGQLYTAA